MLLTKRELDSAAAHYRKMCEIVGLDLSHADLVDTPHRYVRALAEMTQGLKEPDFKFTTFENSGRYDQLIVTRRISFPSLCSHHRLPFIGHADVGILPHEKCRIPGPAPRGDGLRKRIERGRPRLARRRTGVIDHDLTGDEPRPPPEWPRARLPAALRGAGGEGRG